MKSLIYSATCLLTLSIGSAAYAGESYQSTCYLYPVTSGRIASIALDRKDGYKKCSTYESQRVTTSSSSVQTAPQAAVVEQPAAEQPAVVEQKVEQSTVTQSATPTPAPETQPQSEQTEQSPSSVRALW
jgi:hypothetical protein